jgi:hypothetical protein
MILGKENAMWAVNRVASSVLGIVLLVGGLLAAIEAAVLAAGRSPWLVPLDRWHATLSSMALSDSRVLGASIVVGVIGLAVLALELRPWPPQRLLTGDAGDPWWVARRSVEQRTAAAATGVTGVHHARADVRGNERRWWLRMRAEANPEYRDEVVGAVRRELDRLAVPQDIAVKVALRPPRRVS